MKMEIESVTIAAAASLSSAASCQGRALAGILMPAAWTAADLTFQASVDGTTYGNFYTVAGAEITVIATVDNFIQIEPSGFSGPLYLKVRSGPAGAAQNQAAARIITLVFREV